MHAQLSLILQDPFIQPGHALVGTRAHQLRKAQGDFLLGVKVQGQAQRLFAVRQREAHEHLLQKCLGDLPVHQLGLGVQHLAGPVQQHLARQVGVPPARSRLPHQVKQRRPDAEFALGVDAHAQRHAVRREKAHALYIHHHAVGILAHELHRVLAVVLGDAHGQRGTDAVILQKHQRPAHAHLLQIAFGDHGGLFGADAGQLGQALGCSSRISRAFPQIG